MSHGEIPQRRYCDRCGTVEPYPPPHSFGSHELNPGYWGGVSGSQHNEEARGLGLMRFVVTAEDYDRPPHHESKVLHFCEACTPVVLKTLEALKLTNTNEGT